LELDLMSDRLRIALTGAGDEQIWHMSARERIARLAAKAGLDPADDPRGADILADPGFVFDPLWLDHVVAHPGTVVTWQGRPVLAHVRSADQAGAVAAGQLPDDMRTIASEHTAIPNASLRKLERPFLMPLTPETRAQAEHACYRGAYKGVTDLLTKYLWPGLAYQLTRLAARLGLTPNMVTVIGLLFCIAAGVAFYNGAYAAGMAAGFVSMVLDTVDGKLARCTITSSRFGDALDHGIDLIHPPLWWWAWGEGLAAYKAPLPDDLLTQALMIILGSYVLQRVIEGIFIWAFGMHIHVWRPLDSRFRLITARRNPNMLLLLLFLVAGEPDAGFVALAAWSLLSLLFHALRLAQAFAESMRGEIITSWLSQPASPRRMIRAARRGASALQSPSAATAKRSCTTR
jgi:phosphatidylglycerophosphate synthase